MAATAYVFSDRGAVQGISVPHAMAFGPSNDEVLQLTDAAGRVVAMFSVRNILGVVFEQHEPASG